jgi:Uma2 family endonuclease
MTALAAPRIVRKSETRTESTRRVVLHAVPWDAYTAIREALRDRRIFLTYDEGTLEIMTLSAEHEQLKSNLGLLVSILARHFRKNFCNCGSFTQQRKELLKGVEQDECFYLDSLPKVLGKKNIDLNRDPPPDLGLEIDVAHSSLNRLPIFAALKIPEVWRFRADSLTVHVLAGKEYEVRDSSPTFPGVPMAKLVGFVYLGIEKGEMVMWEEFEKWLRTLPRPRAPKRKGKKGK